MDYPEDHGVSGASSAQVDSSGDHAANGASTLDSYEHAVSDDWFHESGPLATWLFLCLHIQFVEAMHSY